VEHGDFEAAARVFLETSNFSEICGRVCPQLTQCEGACPHNKKGQPPVTIGRIEAFVSDWYRQNVGHELSVDPPTGRRVAVVGAGPAGLTVAELLSKKGHSVTIFDQWPDGGGVMRYGIPRFKMDHALVDARLEYLKSLGVEFVYDTRIGEERGIDDLTSSGFDAVFLGTGAGIAAQIEIPGSDLEGIYSSTPFLVRANVEQNLRPSSLEDPPDIGDRVAVIGGGDTAMDCCRTALRMGASEVTCVYRRTEEEMPGNARDREYAKEEGTRFEWLVAPVRFVGDERGRVRAMECVRMSLGEPDESGRRRPLPIEGSEFEIPVDTVLLALGYWPDPALGESTPGLDTHDWGLFTVDEETGRTSREGVWAGGDNVLGPAVVVTAVAHGWRAAADIHRHLTPGQGTGGADAQEDVVEE
jgi:glutamate synthase (NADPH/NADH) small chain